VAVKSVGRAVHLVSFALKRAAEAGVPFERLVQLMGGSQTSCEGLEQAVPEPSLLLGLAPAGTDARAVAQAAATFDATTRLHGLTQRVLASRNRIAAARDPRRRQSCDEHDQSATSCRLSTAISASSPEGPNAGGSEHS